MSTTVTLTVDQAIQRAAGDRNLEVEAVVTLPELQFTTVIDHLMNAFRTTDGMVETRSPSVLDVSYNASDFTHRVTISGEDLCAYHAENSITTLFNEVGGMTKKMIGTSSEYVQSHGARVNVKRETNLEPGSEQYMSVLANMGNSNVLKHYRYKHRTSFTHPAWAWRIDVTQVKASPNGSPTLSGSNLHSQHPFFELEIELVNPDNADASRQLRSILSIVGTIVQRGEIFVDKGLLGKTVSWYSDTTCKWKELTRRPIYHSLTPNQIVAACFLNPKPAPFENKHYALDVTDIFDDHKYAITYKADGENMNLAIRDGSLFLMSSSGGVGKLAAKAVKGGVPITDTLLAVEEIVVGNRTFYLAYDILVYNGEAVWKKSLVDRIADLDKVLLSLVDVGRQIVKKPHWIPDRANPIADIISKMKPYLDGVADTTKRLDPIFKPDFAIDGLIFTRIENTFGESLAASPKILKWKPAHLNTIDAIVKFEDSSTVATINSGYRPGNDIHVLEHIYMDIHISNGLDSSRDGYRVRPIFEIPIVHEEGGAVMTRENIPDGVEVPRLVMYTDGVYEIKFVMGTDNVLKPIPIRTRHDKLNRYRVTRSLGDGVVNDFSRTVKPILDLVAKPITTNMLCKPNKRPPVVFNDEYYVENERQRKGSVEMGAMRRAHNRYKEMVLKDLASAVRKTSPEADSLRLIDIGSGRGGDMLKWVGFDRIIGVDNSYSNIYSVHDSAYKRLHEQKGKGLAANKQLLFLKLDAGKPFADVVDCPRSIGDTNNTMANKMFNTTMLNVVTSGKVPPSDYPEVLGTWKNAIVNGSMNACTCMFALHYFLDDETKFKTLLANVTAALDTNGIFCCTVLDASRMDSLYDKEGVYSVSSDQGLDIEVTRLHEPKPKTIFGNRIRVYVDSIGQEITENAVFVDRLCDYMKDHGFEIVETGNVHTSLTASFDRLSMISNNSTKGFMYLGTAKLMDKKYLEYSNAHRVVSWTKIRPTK